MASGRDDIIELKPDPITEDTGDFKAGRNFSVIAGSQLDARAKLIAAGVQVGAVWTTLYGETYSSNIVCRSLQVGEGSPQAPNITGGEGDYLCKATYGRLTSGESAINGAAIYRFSGSLESSPADVDARGFPIANTADEPIDPALTFLRTNEILSIEWWAQFETLAALAIFLRTYRGALNVDEWHGADPGTFLCHAIENTDEAENNWHKLSGRFEYREPIVVANLESRVKVRGPAGDWIDAPAKLPGWADIRADRGTREKIVANAGDPGGYRDIIKGGKAVKNPVLLGGNGLELAGGERSVALAYEMQAKLATFATLGV